ncbi:MAG: 16S rRNA (uracil(1498)-N(3))-methyltransferase [Nitrospiraceae bacterium]|nr:16S rRNA (uracil(1498)-N(3))-methyltransferase [Nitrospiraceae bacterium]
MNLILLFETDFSGEGHRVRLGGRRLGHLRDVHRAAVGDELCVGLAGGLIGTGRVVSLDSDAAEMEVRFDRSPPPPLPVTLILALPRPKYFRRVLFTVSALGVKRIFVVNSYRVEKSYWQSPFLGRPQVEKQLVLGLEQARDTVMPEVLFRPLFKPFVEDELPSIVRGTLPLLADPHAGEPFPRAVTGPVTLAIGPEGGFIPYETAKLLSAGFAAARLGERILNVEAAVPALLSRLF